MEVKPVDSETKVEQRKLFVGTISKNTDEEKLRVLFCEFGTIADVKILRNQDGTSKNCAFIKFSSRLAAQKAIKEMHNSHTMEVVIPAKHDNPFFLSLFYLFLFLSHLCLSCILCSNVVNINVIFKINMFRDAPRRL